MTPDLWSLYTLMLKSRMFEEAIAQLWNDGFISGEMHLGTGEEAIIAGVISHLQEGDAIALDHRGSAAMLMRGVDPVLILGELLGHPDGLCGGKGGHMHLFSKEHLMASSGIVGASGPAAAGFALSAQYLKTDGIAVGFFGEGAMNQGMLLESLNLASVWTLPVLFVCKDDGWAITAETEQFTGGTLNDRVQGFGIPYVKVNGLDVSTVWKAAREAIDFIRSGKGPQFIHANCVHLEGHFLGYQLLRAIRSPLSEMTDISVPLTRSFLQRGGADLRERLSGLKSVLGAVLSTVRDPRRDQANDPISHTRITLSSDSKRLKQLEQQIEKEINEILESVLGEVRA
jgi:pyruvate dehydrogenase E1 component alpha subunit